MVVLGVTGGIAAYKAADLVSRLKKRGIAVSVIMTENATHFVSPLTFESLSENPVAVDMFAEKVRWEVEHISLAKKARVFVVAPATANVVAKLAHGIADDMLTTTALATKGQMIVCPAMNTAMYENIAVQENIETLRKRGVIIVEPASGRLACGDIGKGKLADVETIEAVVVEQYASLVGGLQREGNQLSADAVLLAGKKVVVTAGPTVEMLDPVRYITNKSSGKMGYAFAEQAVRMGADVVLISGPTKLDPPKGVELIRIQSTADLFNQCMAHADADLVIMAAAPVDFAPAVYSEQKIKKGGDETMMLELKKNPDIIKSLKAVVGDRAVLLAFAAETEHLIENAKKKLASKKVDFVLANDVTAEGAGFDVDTNIATLISEKGIEEAYPKLSKRELAERVLRRLVCAM